MPTEHSFTVKTVDGAEHTLTRDRILANNVIEPGSYNPHNVRMHLIGCAHGALAVVWASALDEALDEACDAGLVDAFLMDDEASDNVEEHWSNIGNNGLPADLTDMWAAELAPLLEQSPAFVFAMAHAPCASGGTTAWRGASRPSISDLSRRVIRRLRE